MLYSSYSSQNAFSLLRFLVVIFACLHEGVQAAPGSGYGLSRRQNNGSVAQNPDPNSSTSLSPQVWIPIAIIAVLIVTAALVLCARRGGFSRLTNWATGAALASGTVIRANNGEGPREITADQLAGGDATAAAATTDGTAANNGTTRAARRPRRTRRTPSQISTKSLPAYMKEPGDQELVIIRGPEDMEDVTATIVDMPLSADTTPGLDSSDSTLREDISRTNSHSPEYEEVPTSPHDQPLLHPDNSPIGRRSSQRSLHRVSTRPSFDTLLTSSDDADSAALIRAHPVPPALIDARGEAPPYFEVVSMDDLSRNISITTDSHQHSSVEVPNPEPSPPPQNAGSRIRSSILNLFSPRNPSSAPPMPPVPSSSQLSPHNIQGRTSHARSESGPSIMSIASTGEGGSRLSHARTRSRPTTPGHRPSHSGTNSVFSISSNFRPLSRARSRSQNRLNAEALTSPSLISLNSISAPLTHTAVKTSLMYPKAGPTADQMKLIASRESFAKFGLPYGPDAIAFASHSRVDLSQGPPPGFEEVVGSGQAGPSGEGSGSGSHDPPSPEYQQDEGEVESPIPLTDSPVEDPSTSTSGPETVNQSTSDSVAARQLSASPTLSVPQPPGSAVPPSAFRDPASATLPRAESRASSYLSFATAEESLHSSGDSVYLQSTTPATPATPHHLITTPTTPAIIIPQDDRSGQNGEAMEGLSSTPSTTNGPPTPTMSSRHIHEPTDTTVIVSLPTPTTPTTPFTTHAI
ncbi:hypothetical protein QCA50_018995 [Cerrena zonata]|uniref:Transmembrane protein n=1 Tax=Cerrena zonata TaxID=2478898 RepID=A0AAW0FIR6_9APHY